jgi:hypothetical protein
MKNNSKNIVTNPQFYYNDNEQRKIRAKSSGCRASRVVTLFAGTTEGVSVHIFGKGE